MKTKVHILFINFYEQKIPRTSRFTFEVERHFYVKVFFIATTRVVTLQLSLHAFIMHVQCFNYL